MVLTSALCVVMTITLTTFLRTVATTPAIWLRTLYPAAYNAREDGAHATRDGFLGQEMKEEDEEGNHATLPAAVPSVLVYSPICSYSSLA